MDDYPLAILEPDERNLLGVFARYGRDGRAITTESLAALAGFAAERERFSRALRRLLTSGVIKETGGDSFVGSPLAYRLAQRLPHRPRREVDKQNKAIRPQRSTVIAFRN